MVPAGRAAGDSVNQAGDRAARDAMDAAPDARTVTTEMGDGSLRTVDEPGVPRIKDDALKAAQLAEAEIAAETIVHSNDIVDTPVPVVLAQLIVLKRWYRWIDTFRADTRAPGQYEFVMVASEHRLGTYTIEVIEVNGRQVEVVRAPQRGGGRAEPEFRASPEDVAPPAHGVPEPHRTDIDPDVQQHLDESLEPAEPTLGEVTAEAEAARRATLGEAAERVEANKLKGSAGEIRVEGEILSGKPIPELGSTATLRGSQVYVETPAGLRIIDHLVELPTGELVALEVKTGKAVRSRYQLDCDLALQLQGGRRVGDGPIGPIRTVVLRR